MKKKMNHQIVNKTVWKKRKLKNGETMHSQKNSSEEFLFPSNVYSWIIHKETEQYKKYKEHIKLKEVSIAREMKK